MKISDRQAILKKVIALLKKRYSRSLPKDDRTVLETLLYGICLENASFEEAQAAFERLFQSFFDLNEMRVSTISELETCFDGLPDAEWRALRVRSTLQSVFEKQYAFDLEPLRRATLDAATKRLAKIPHLSPFVRTYTLQNVLGSHLVPLDERMRVAAVWLGLVDPEASLEEACESLKSLVRKSDVPLFCYLLRKLATDPALARALKPKKKGPAPDAESAPERLAELFEKLDQRPSRTAKTRRKATAKSAAKKSKAARASAGRKTTRRKTTTGRSAAKKTTTKRRKSATRG